MNNREFTIGIYWSMTKKDLLMQIELMEGFLASQEPGEPSYDHAKQFLPHAKQCLHERDFSLDNRWFALMKGVSGWHVIDTDTDRVALFERVKVESGNWEEEQFHHAWVTEAELRRVIGFGEEEMYHAKLQFSIE
jgi:hypothetical protein